MRTRILLCLLTLGIAASVVGALSLRVSAQPPQLKKTEGPQTPQTATGQQITPTAVPGAVLQFLNPGLAAYPNFVAGEAVRSELSPDGNTLAILCAGQNSLVKPDGTTDTAASTQFIFLYDVSPKNKQKPLLVQVIQQTNSHVGLVFSPDGSTLYATGGKDDAVYSYTKSGNTWTLFRKIALGHPQGLGIGVSPNASGLAISHDGQTLVVANNYNDSISVIDTGTSTKRFDYDLRPWSPNNEGIQGGIGGTFPFAVAVHNFTVYVSSDRDREVIAVDTSVSNGRLIKRIKLDGNALGMLLDPSGSTLYVAEDNADEVAVIDTASNNVVAKIDATGVQTKKKGTRYTGAATFAVRLSPDGKTLYAVNSAANDIAVIPLTGKDAYQVAGLIPTAYEPHDITFSKDGTWMYIINGKSITGPNPGHLNSSTAQMTLTYGSNAAALAIAAAASNQYQFQLEHASLVSAPVPTGKDLESLTDQVAQNNYYDKEKGQDKEVIHFLRDHIKHIIYIVKENRTFDQILGDLKNGANADQTLNQFPQQYTPSFHKLSTQFVTLDNFTDPGDGSMDGWSWALQGRVTNTETITQQINYAFVNRGLSYESEGSNRNVPVNWGTVSERDAAAGLPPSMNYSTATAGLPGGTANVLTGTGNHASSDAPFGIQKGYIHNSVLNAGKTVRNYGFHVNNIGKICTDPTNATTCKATPIANPFMVGAIQVAPLDPELASLTDVYFRGFDQAVPDLWRYNEWKREFDQYVANNNLPSLSQVRLSHDHMGSFGSALAGVSIPESQQADDDVSVGLLIQAVANSKYAADTLIIVTEDDCQDGPDHVDSHRATAYVAGPYVKQGVVVSTHYSQVNVLRTIEDILGTEHNNLNTAFQRPMTDVFDIKSSGVWTFQAEASCLLLKTDLKNQLAPLLTQCMASSNVKPKHDATYWAKATAGFDFSDADRVPPAKFNRVLWKGLMGRRPYPGPAGQATGKVDVDD